MGPRLVSRGNSRRHIPKALDLGTSMGPRLVSRGNSLERAFKWPDIGVLQWGRDSLVAEIKLRARGV